MMKKRHLPVMAPLVIIFVLAVFAVATESPALAGMAGEKQSAKAGASIKHPPLKELTSAAEAGDREARYRLGYIYEKGRGITRDYATAMRWYLLAAAQGHTGAQVRLGRMYAEGHGVKRDYKKAAKWFTEAAEHGNAEAQYNLGLLFYAGDGVPRDYVMSYMWLNLAGAGGYEAARKRLDKLEPKMPPGEVELAQKLSREFKVK